jgi:hypothetical protein
MLLPFAQYFAFAYDGDGMFQKGGQGCGITLGESTFRRCNGDGLTFALVGRF